MTVSVIIDNMPYQVLPGTFALTEAQQNFTRALKPFRDIIELSGNTQADIQAAIQNGTYHTDLANAITTLLGLADPGLTDDEKALLGKADSELTNVEREIKKLIKQKLLTEQMAKALDVLFRTLKAAGVPTDGSAITTDQVIAWKNLSDNTTAIQEILDIAASLVRESDLALGKTESLQSLIELVYVKTGNELLFEAMEGLETGLDSTQRALGTLVKLQDLHNQITVEEKTRLVTGGESRPVTVTRKNKNGKKEKQATIDVYAGWPTEWTWTREFIKSDRIIATTDDIEAWDWDSEMWITIWAREGYSGADRIEPYNYIDPSFPLDNVIHGWEGELLQLNVQQNNAFADLQVAYNAFNNEYQAQTLQDRALVTKMNDVLASNNTTGISLPELNIISVAGYESFVIPTKQDNNPSPFEPNFNKQQGINSLNEVIQAWNQRIQNRTPKLEDLYDDYVNAIGAYNTEIGDINAALATITSSPEYAGFTGITPFPLITPPPPPVFWNTPLEDFSTFDPVIYYTGVSFADLPKLTDGQGNPVLDGDGNPVLDLPDGIVFYPKEDIINGQQEGLIITFPLFVDSPSISRLDIFQEIIFANQGENVELAQANPNFPPEDLLDAQDLAALNAALTTVNQKLIDGEYTTEAEMFEDLTNLFTQVNDNSPPALDVVGRRALAAAKVLASGLNKAIGTESVDFPIRTTLNEVPQVTNVIPAEADPLDLVINVTNAAFLAQFQTQFDAIKQEILDLIEELKTVKEFYDNGIIPRDQSGNIQVEASLTHSLLGRLVILRDDINRSGALETWIFDSYREGNQISGMNPGEIQRNITAALSAGQSLNDTQKEEVRRFLFIFEEYYKSSAAILNKITQIIEKMAQGIAR